MSDVIERSKTRRPPFSDRSACLRVAADDGWVDVYRDGKEPVCRWCGRALELAKPEENSMYRERTWHAVQHECETWEAEQKGYHDEIRRMVNEPSDEATAEIRTTVCLPKRMVMGLHRLTETEGNRAALEAARSALTAFQEGRRDRGLFLYGAAGCGKTCIMTALAFDLALRTGVWKHPNAARATFRWGAQAEVRYWPVSELFAAIKATFGNGGAEFDEGELLAADALVLDDLGKQMATPWSVLELFRLIDVRYSELQATFYTSNFSLPELATRMITRLGAEYAPDVAALIDRIKGTCEVVEVRGASWR